MDEKNLFCISPAPSPLLKIHKFSEDSKNCIINEKSLTFVSLPPYLLTGFAKTFKSICMSPNEEMMISSEEEENEDSMIKMSFKPQDRRVMSKFRK